jgi:hypothetical protein
MQTVASIGFGPHPDWVSYLVKDPQGKWVHSTPSSCRPTR